MGPSLWFVSGGVGSKFIFWQTLRLMQTDTRCVTDGNLGLEGERYVQEVVAEVSMYSGIRLGGWGLNNQQANGTGPDISTAHALGTGNGSI